ncbi:HAD-IIIC family phosphatase [Amycolatopsis speibonae]|uniref:HAD-IIIC family phosphatase n=1 Tax=Amycolatopsis speibonae TaxID=1450224 RepID=A0ABV7P7V0_9PSEU
MNDFTELLGGLRMAVADRSAPAPGLRQRLAEVEDPAVVRQAGRVLAELPPAGPALRPIRMAVLATCTIGPFEHLLRAALVATGTQPTLLLGDYGTFELTLADGEIDGSPDVVTCLLDERYFLPRDWSAADPAGLAAHVAARFAELRGLLLAFLRRMPATLVLHTVPVPAELRDSLISWRARAVVGQAWHRLNADLLGLAEEDSRITVVDLAGELADLAVAARDERLYRYADLPYTDGALLALARQVARVVAARSGLSRKVLALDLDNTLWGGVLGEVGETGLHLGGLYPGNCYQDLQRAVRRLREQGVILVLASKNDAGPVDKALADHPEMVLRPQDFAVRAVNWTAKADNLRHAAETLNLAGSAFVFMDDSPFERGHVAAELPEVAVVSADGDPAGLVRSLLRPGWFDVPELTDTDLKRPALYRSRALRTDFSSGFASSEDYLRALRTRVTAHPVTAFEVGRVAQLSARTNQFNLTGRRFDEAATTAMSTDPDQLAASFAVADRFGDEGIVGAAWIECRDQVWRVLNLVLSCRVFGRGIEFAIVDWIVRRAREAGAIALVGHYAPTGRNTVANGFWEKAGFTPSGEDGTYTVVPGTAPTCLPTWITYPETSDDRHG